MTKLGALMIGLALTFVSLPWIIWSLTCAAAGDEEAADRWADSMPLIRWLDRAA